ncbi:MAG: hypothetical protein LBK73_01525 [Treponema sp.]|nr:hypothetical protein [Treponema sp.]
MAKDVCGILGINNASQALADFPESEKDTLIGNEV